MGRGLKLEEPNLGKGAPFLQEGGEWGWEGLRGREGILSPRSKDRILTLTGPGWVDPEAEAASQ